MNKIFISLTCFVFLIGLWGSAAGVVEITDQNIIADEIDVTGLTTNMVNPILYVQAGNGSDIQAKIDDCPNTGCKIVIPAGNYNYSSTPTINNKENVLVEGEPDTVLKPSGNIVGFRINGSKNIILRNLTIDSSDNALLGGTDSIWLTYVNDSVIEHNSIINHLDCSSQFTSADAIEIDYSSNNKIQYNYIFNISEGIQIGASATVGSYNNQIIYNYLDNIGKNSTHCGQDGIEPNGIGGEVGGTLIAYNYIGKWTPSNSGIDVYKEVTNTKIIGNILEGSGIRVGDSETRNVVIMGNTLKGRGIRSGTGGKYYTISGNVVTDSTGGIEFSNAEYVTITGNIVKNITGSGYGIRAGSYSSIVGNTINKTARSGITIGHRGTVSDNIVIGAGTVLSPLRYSVGIEVTGNYTTVSNNYFDGRINDSVAKSNTMYGIYLSSSSNNVTNNTVANNKYGIRLYNSINNKIYHNNIINNTNQAYDNGPLNNFWYHPTLLEGNYWSDYTGVDDGSGTGKHAIAGDGIGDTLIPHPSSNYDSYPFINPNGWINSPKITATVDIDPDTIKLVGGRKITAYIELPFGYDVNEINISTVKLNNVVLAMSRPVKVGDHDGDGITDLMVRFDKREVTSLLTLGDNEITIWGELNNGTPFEGSDTIRVLDRKGK